MTSTPQPYKPPQFADRISTNAPKYRLHLAMRPTPIQPWDLHTVMPDLPRDVTFHIKRDDMTGSTTSGNKIRKLEFILAHAIASGHTSVITAGGVQSNHARATAVAARELGLGAHVFLRSGNPHEPDKLGCDGNVLIHKMLGAELYLVKPMPYLTGLLPKMTELADKLMREKDEKAYIIGIGGSNPVGLWGYIDCFNEMIEQGVCDNYTDVVVAVGSGGTASGLAIGNYLSGSNIRVHAITVCDDEHYFYNHLDEMLEAVGLGDETCARDILNIIEAKGKGYAINTEAELKLCLKVSKQTGILLDPVYTLKGLFGMFAELKNNRRTFAADARILFVHTGGIYGLFDRRIEPFLDDSLTKTWSQ